MFIFAKPARPLFLLSACAAALIWTAPAMAEEAAVISPTPETAKAEAAESNAAASPWELSGSVTLASEYMTRGFSDSDSHPALQGSVSLAHESGWAAEIWASNVDYNDSWEAKAEVDFYLTYSFGMGPGDMTVGAGYYLYPGAKESLDYDHYEFFASYESALPNDIATLGAEIYYSPDFFLDSGSAVYVTATADVPVPVVEGLSVVGHIGHQSIEDNSRFGIPDYIDYSAGLGYTFDPFYVDLRYYATDVSKARCDNLCGPTVMGSITWEW